MAHDLLFCHIVGHGYIFRLWPPMGIFQAPHHHDFNVRQPKMSSKICFQEFRFFGGFGCHCGLTSHVGKRADALLCLGASRLVNFPPNASTVKLRPRRVCKIWIHIPSGLKVSTRGNRSWVPPIHIARHGLPSRVCGHKPPSA